MLKKTITWVDFNKNQHTEDFYFHLSKSELAELQLSQRGGLQEFLKRIVADDDGEEIIRTFKKILEMSFGERSEDGKYFFKTPEAWMRFYSSGAYDVLFMELVTDSGAGATFVNGVVPQNLADKLPEKMKELENVSLPEELKPEDKRQFSDYTHDELLNMSQGDFDKLVNRHGHNVPRGLLTVAMQRRTSPREV